MSTETTTTTKPKPKLLSLKDVSRETNVSLDTLRRSAREAASRGLLRLVSTTWVCEEGDVQKVAELARSFKAAASRAARLVKVI